MRGAKPSATARIVALTRSELERPASPSGDCQAEARLYRSLGRPPALLGQGAQWRESMARRTRFFDACVLQALDEGVAQVVIVAAGYDGRPLRFATPGVRFFEVDHPSTQDDKRARLEQVGAETGPISFVAVDLNAGRLAASLEEAGFDRAVPALFTLEGVLSYLPRATIASTLADLRRLSVGGSRLAAGFPLAPSRDAPPSQRLKHRARATVVRGLGEPWRTRFRPAEVDEVLARAGWAVASGPEGPRRFEGARGVLLVGRPAA